jgi:Ca2+-binding EF-hand superfamily protein
LHSPARDTLNQRFGVAEELKEERKYQPKEDRLSSSKKTLRTTYTLKGNEQNEFAETLRDLVDLDRNLEEAKIDLAFKKDFTLYDAFRTFDYNNNGTIVLDDVINAYKVFHIHPTREEARLFLSRYDTRSNNRLTFNEFCDAIMPLDEEAAEALRRRSVQYPDGYYHRRDEFSWDTINALSRVLKLHIEAEVNAEVLRQKHESDPNFRYDDAFSTLNKWGEDYLTEEDFEEFFKKYGFYPNDTELNVLMNRFDKDKDGKVSYDEFFDEFSPHSPTEF